MIGSAPTLAEALRAVGASGSVVVVSNSCPASEDGCDGEAVVHYEIEETYRHHDGGNAPDRLVIHRAFCRECREFYPAEELVELFEPLSEVLK